VLLTARPRKVRFVIVGGFLGAGKTTALLRAAQAYVERGMKVGLVTNDQAANLVDTRALQVRGLRVEEVAGACFCCKFDDLARSAETIRREELPDVLFGEPVGSCTDLVATVVRPLARFYGDRYEIAPYSVLVDPSRARALVLEKGFGGFSSKVAYVFAKQLEEADLICLNKADLLREGERGELRAALEAEHPRAHVLLTSAKTGEGFGEWFEFLERPGSAGANVAQVDYDLYAEGEAELGWYNAAVRIEAARPFEADRFVRDLLESLSRRLAERRAEVAHLKVLLEAPRGVTLGNLVGGGSAPSLSLPLGETVEGGRLLVNARVHVDPDSLRAVAEECLAAVASAHAVRAVPEQTAALRPGRPVPVHRFGSGA
jgi:G3E family GTPase